MESEVRKLTGGSATRSARRHAKKRKIFITGVIVPLSSLLIIYLGMTIYFTNHFYFGSKINDIGVSGKTVEEVKNLMTGKFHEYTLTLKGRDGKDEKINGKAIGLKFNSEDEIQYFKDRQKPFNWISGIISKVDSSANIDIAYDEELLKENIDKLSYFETSNIIEPKNAIVEYKDNSYVIIDEVLGNKIDKDKLHSSIKNAILSGEAMLDIDAEDCYINPQITSKLKEIVELKDTLNKYISTEITYTFGDKKETLDGAIINTWLTFDDNYEITIDNKMVRAFVDGLAMKYNTFGKTRTIETSSGITRSIGGGDYGWIVDKIKEIEDIILTVKEGQTLTKEPAYFQRAYSHGVDDIGNTYVEIDMTKQHLWFYKDGKLVVEGDIVTGNMSLNYATPPGIYVLKYKERKATLRGENYETPVDYWMPFNGNIGLHDATWRNVFGGQIYKTSGSHGCVNAPYNLAKTVFNNIESGTAFICYY